MASNNIDGPFIFLCFAIISVSALTLILTLMSLAKMPPGRSRRLTMAGVFVVFLIGTPVVLYFTSVIKYLFFDEWH